MDYTAFGHDLGGINPDEAQLKHLEEMAAKGVEGPFHFVNLLSFHEHAQYPEGHEFADKGLSGKDAYNMHYGPVALKHVMQRGGKLTVWADVVADVVADVIGSQTQWHQTATMEYQSIEAFLDMAKDPDYQSGLVHRDAGLRETIVLATKPLL